MVYRGPKAVWLAESSAESNGVALSAARFAQHISEQGGGRRSCYDSQRTNKW